MYVLGGKGIEGVLLAIIFIVHCFNRVCVYSFYPFPAKQRTVPPPATYIYTTHHSPIRKIHPKTTPSHSVPSHHWEQHRGTVATTFISSSLRYICL